MFGALYSKLVCYLVRNSAKVIVNYEMKYQLINMSCVCKSDLYSPRHTYTSYFGHRLDDDGEDSDDTKTNTTDEESYLISHHQRALTKARFVKAYIIYNVSLL